MTTYRAAVIGLGRIASTIDEEIEKYDGHALPYSHIACYTEVPEVALVGMADTWAERREAAERKWNFTATYHDYKTMLRETRPDIVSVCTSTKPRAEVVVEIATGGYGVRAIWAEKPIALSLEDADRIVTACSEAGIVLAVNCVRRWRDDYRQAVAMIDDGHIGDLLHVQALGNCGISHNGSHLLTTMTMFAGSRVEWVMGEAEVDISGPDDDFQAAGYVGFANGARGYFRTFCNGPNEWSFDVIGTDGMIRVIDDGRAIEHWVLNEPANGMRKQAPAKRVLPPPLRQHSPGVNAVYDMIDCIESGGDAPMQRRRRPRSAGNRHRHTKIPRGGRSKSGICRSRIARLLIIPREVLRATRRER